MGRHLGEGSPTALSKVVLESEPGLSLANHNDGREIDVDGRVNASHALANLGEPVWRASSSASSLLVRACGSHREPRECRRILVLP